MTRIISKYKSACLALALGCSLALTTSCTDYLDKSPESDVSPEAAFKNFKNFQGFTEELYLCIPDFSKSYWTTCWNWGEDDIQAVGIDYLMGYKVDQGDFWGWQKEFDGWGACFMDQGSSFWIQTMLVIIIVFLVVFGRLHGMASVRQIWAWRIWT